MGKDSTSFTKATHVTEPKQTLNGEQKPTPDIVILTHNYSKETTGKPLRKIKNKEGGANSSGAFGGIYVIEEYFAEEGLKALATSASSEEERGEASIIRSDSTDSTASSQSITSTADPTLSSAPQSPTPATTAAQRLLLVKHDKPYKDMAEYLAGKFFAAVVPDYAAKIDIIRDRRVVPDPTGENVYIGSHFLTGYQDLFKVVDEPRAPHKDGRVFAAGTVNKLTGFLRRSLLKPNNTPKYEGFPQTMVTSLLIGDFDVHTGNIGLVPSSAPGVEGRLVRIDYGGAFKRIETEIHPHSRSRHPWGQGPTNHFREFPRELRVSQEFAEHALEVANTDFTPTITEAITELKQHYGKEAFLAFAKNLMDKESYKKLDPNQDIADQVQAHLTMRIKERQKSLRQFSLEINIGLCFDEKGEYVKGGEERLTKLMQDPNNKDYFAKLTKDKELHLRSKNHKNRNLLDWICGKERKLKTAIISKISKKRGELIIAEGISGPTTSADLKSQVREAGATLANAISEQTQKSKKTSSNSSDLTTCAAEAGTTLVHAIVAGPKEKKAFAPMQVKSDTLRGISSTTQRKR